MKPSKFEFIRQQVYNDFFYTFINNKKHPNMLLNQSLLNYALEKYKTNKTYDNSWKELFDDEEKFKQFTKNISDLKEINNVLGEYWWVVNTHHGLMIIEDIDSMINEMENIIDDSNLVKDLSYTPFYKKRVLFGLYEELDDYYNNRPYDIERGYDIIEHYKDELDELPSRFYNENDFIKEHFVSLNYDPNNPNKWKNINETHFHLLNQYDVRINFKETNIMNFSDMVVHLINNSKDQIISSYGYGSEYLQYRNWQLWKNHYLNKNKSNHR